MKLLKARNVLWPEWYKEYHIGQLENFYNYDRLHQSNRRTDAQVFRLECLMKDMDEHGLLYPIIVSWTGYRVSVGHQRVWYAYKRGYTHISCYHVPNQRIWDRIMKSDYSDEYWQSRLPENKKILLVAKNAEKVRNLGYKVEGISCEDITTLDENTPEEDKKAMDAMLVKEIPEKGMLWPILVRPTSDPMWEPHRHKMKNPLAKYTVWYGNNRYRYACRNKFTHIAAVCLYEFSGKSREELCGLMNIPTRRNKLKNEYLELGRSIVNTKDQSTA